MVFKQNFTLHFFYGDSVNAIQIQTWVVLIANLLITVMSRSIKRHCAFSHVVTMVQLMLMYYVDFIAFMENPDKTWNNILAKEELKAPPEPSFFRLGMLTFEKQTPKSNFTGFRGGYLCSLEFYRTAIFDQISSFIARPLVWLVGIRALEIHVDALTSIDILYAVTPT